MVRRVRASRDPRAALPASALGVSSLLAQGELRLTLQAGSERLDPSESKPLEPAPRKGMA